MKELDSDFFINPGCNIDKDNGEIAVIIRLSKEPLRARWKTSK
jgi:hypothetical protein